MMDWNGMPSTSLQSIHRTWISGNIHVHHQYRYHTNIIVFFFKEFNVHGTMQDKKSLVELCNCCGGGNEESEKRV